MKRLITTPTLVLEAVQYFGQPVVAEDIASLKF